MEQAAVAAQRLRGRPQRTHRCWFPVNNCIHKPFTWDRHCLTFPAHQPTSALENASWFCWPTRLGQYLTILLLLGNSHSQPIKKIKWDLPVLTNFHLSSASPSKFSTPSICAARSHVCPISLHRHLHTHVPRQPNFQNTEGPAADISEM